MTRSRKGKLWPLIVLKEPTSLCIMYNETSLDSVKIMSYITVLMLYCILLYIDSSKPLLTLISNFLFLSRFLYALWISHTNMAIAYSTQGHKLSG